MTHPSPTVASSSEPRVLVPVKLPHQPTYELKAPTEPMAKMKRKPIQMVSTMTEMRTCAGTKKMKKRLCPSGRGQGAGSRGKTHATPRYTIVKIAQAMTALEAEKPLPVWPYQTMSDRQRDPHSPNALCERRRHLKYPPYELNLAINAASTAMTSKAQNSVTILRMVTVRL
jgi:hypothetical protein